jgi:hypothetical protein
MRNAIGIVMLIGMGVVVGVGGTAWTQERHPEIRAAMHALANAERHLADGARDFGGHRAKALRLVKQAEAELREAVAYDRAHEPSGPRPAAATKPQ